MKRTLFYLLAGFTLSLNAQTDFFEGRISLKYQYFDSLGNEMNPMALGEDSVMHYFISGGDYKSLNEKGVIKQLYNSSTNKYYFNNDGIIQVMDASIKYPQKGEVKQLEGEEIILDWKCSKLSIKSENDLTTYYYTDKIMVNKDFYQNHNFGSWNLFLNSTNGALALKYVIEFPAMTITMEAHEVVGLELSNSDFNIESYIEK